MLNKALVFSAVFAVLGTSACTSGEMASQSEVQRVELKTRSFSLDECGGTLEANMSDTNQVSIVLRDVKLCSNFTISAQDEVREYKLQGTNGNRGGSYTIPKSMIDLDKSGKILIDINSNSNLHHDTVKLEYTLPVVELSTRKFSLEDCGGTLQAKISGPEQLNIILSDVKNCSNFTISGLGDTREYKLQGENGDRSGSYTIPKSMVNWHRAGKILIDVNSNSGIHHDRVRLEFVLPR